MRIIIIAEAGVNHNGDMKIARQLIDEAAAAGVDYVKFQTFKADKLVKKDAEKAAYQATSTDKSETQYEMLKRLELTHEQHLELIDYCKEKKITFLSTGFDSESIDFLVNIGVDLIKIPSGEITNLPLLRQIAGYNKNVILSSGMATMEDIDNALEVLEKAGQEKDKVILLHCTTEYPTPFAEVNLNAMGAIKRHTGLQVGYSDHTLGIEVPIAAVALGATVIEKHFTLDKTMTGPDHAASLEPHELFKMVSCIRNIEAAMGEGVKKPSPSEIKNMAVARKSIVAACNIAKGEIFTEYNLTVKRPGIGLSPMKWDEVIGTIAKKDFLTDELITC